MDRTELLDAGCRMALAAFLHDLGKLAERGGVFSEHPNLEINRQLYCPYHKPHVHSKEGWWSHLHAAATALAFDDIETHLPPLRAGRPHPFVSATDATDSLINAAAAHHKPDTFLQWCIASADRIASGFERETFEKYNEAKEKQDHIQERLLVFFEEYKPHAKSDNPPTKNYEDSEDRKYRYPLKPLSPNSLFPIIGQILDKKEAMAEYSCLWNIFKDGLNKIPTDHKKNWPLWLDHFDSLWLAVSHAIPSASAFGTKADVSLYDHSKTTAALAVALWRYHHDRGDDSLIVAKAQKERSDWDAEKFLLIQGDFCGIQEFIFGGAAQTQKGAAKLLRGRSAMVSLLTELAALRLLDALSLPPTSQIINAAGKFLIVAPNSKKIHEELKIVRQDFDNWFLKQSFGLASIVIATTTATSNGFVNKKFDSIRDMLFKDLDIAKRQRFSMANNPDLNPVLKTDYTDGVCKHDGRLPVEHEGFAFISIDQHSLGEQLAKSDKTHILVFTEEPDHLSNRLHCDFFGYFVALANETAARSNKILPHRAFDIALPDQDGDKILWNGYARRSINAYVPLHNHDPNADKRYECLQDKGNKGDIKTFEHLAHDDQDIKSDNEIYGVAALGALKGDVDNLGKMFCYSIDNPTFAKWAALSRRMNGFFAIWLPWYCQNEHPNIYTVFAGGDDFFFIGPWRTTKQFAFKLTQKFSAYCAQNPNIHFSAGYAMVKPGYPLRLLGDQAEDALQNAKGQKEKCAFHLHNYTLRWEEYGGLVTKMEALKRLVEDHDLTTAYLYDILGLVDMAENVKKRPENARWRSLLYYRTRRDIADRQKKSGEEADGILQNIVRTVGEEGIGEISGHYRLVLSDHLYSVRKQ